MCDVDRCEINYQRKIFVDSYTQKVCIHNRANIENVFAKLCKYQQKHVGQRIICNTRLKVLALLENLTDDAIS